MTNERAGVDKILVRIRDLSFSYGMVPILDRVNLDIRQGDFIAMIGPNGGGKSTLLKLILGLLRPSAGTIEIAGGGQGRGGHRIGYVPQDVSINRMFPISILDVVLMGRLEPGRHWSRYSSRDRKAAMAALDQMGMAGHAGRKIGELSGGQRQRVFIARALVIEPELLLLDEPTASIDTKGQTDFFNLLKELNRKVTILVVSHDLLVVSQFARSVVCMNNRSLHYHSHGDIEEKDMLGTMYACSVEEMCPLGLIAGTTVSTGVRIMEKVKR